jgi:hypothetical protein
MRIFKYTLLGVGYGTQHIHMPQGSKILTVQMQHGRPRIWALVCEANPIVTRVIKIFGTGHEFVGDPDSYIGTFQEDDGALVWHVFDGGEQS